MIVSGKWLKHQQSKRKICLQYKLRIKISTQEKLEALGDSLEQQPFVTSVICSQQIVDDTQRILDGMHGQQDIETITPREIKRIGIRNLFKDKKSPGFDDINNISHKFIAFLVE